MWTTEQLLSEAVSGRLPSRFSGLDGVCQFNPAELQEGAEQVLARPQAAVVSPAGQALGRRLLAAQWTLLLESLDLPAAPQVLELCAGGSDPVIVALDVLYGTQASYLTVNLNEKLAGELKTRLRGLSLQWRIIPDDAQNLTRHFSEACFDCVCFHHAVNDILQTAVPACHDYDTRDIDWWPNEQMMIEWLGAQHAADGLASVGLPELRRILEAAVYVLRPGGTLCFDHWTWAHHLTLDWFPGDLFNAMIPLAREVALDLSVPLEEVTPSGLDRQWWMVLRKP